MPNLVHFCYNLVISILATLSLSLSEDMFPAGEEGEGTRGKRYRFILAFEMITAIATLVHVVINIPKFRNHRFRIIFSPHIVINASTVAVGGLSRRISLAKLELYINPLARSLLSAYHIFATKRADNIFLRRDHANVTRASPTVFGANGSGKSSV